MYFNREDLLKHLYLSAVQHSVTAKKFGTILYFYFSKFENYVAC